MRRLVLLRGLMASGKSTFIKENNLEQYTLSADKLRLLFQSPVMTVEGKLAISQDNNKKVWDLLFQLLELRMKKGELVIIDATHSAKHLINRYNNLCSEYRYRQTVVDFTDVPLELCLERNRNRDEYQFVPEEAILKCHERLKTETISGKFEVIKPDEFAEHINCIPFDYNDYEKVVIFGDIHGCYEPLKEYFDNNPYNENYGYVFVGDLFDRGLGNSEVFEFIESISENRNVLILQGNHERWLNQYSKDLKVQSDEFMNNTAKQFVEGNIDKKRIRNFYRKIGQLAYFKYRDNVYLVTHGGLPNVPTPFISTEQMIKGVGLYGDSKTVDENWCSNTPSNYYSIHGHRNILDEEIRNTERSFNLCDRVEFGKYLRILEINSNGEFNTIKIKNNVYNENLLLPVSSDKSSLSTNIETDDEYLNKLLKSRLIIKKDLGDGIFSLNFSRNAFQNRKWNELTTKARGLFVDLNTQKIVARSFEKFFSWSEREETKSKNLANTLKFPVIGWRKYNGFLGILSYNKLTDDFFIASKSTNKGDFAGYFREIFYKQVKNIEYLKNYLKVNKVSMAFEVVDLINDPHMIEEENKQEVILLDIIDNTFEFKADSEEERNVVANHCGFRVKEADLRFDNWADLYEWRQRTKNDYSIEVEGWVFEDANGFMLKMKTPFYSFWRHMRTLKQSIELGKYVDTKFLRTEMDAKVYNYMLSINPEILVTMSIIDVRNSYNNQREGLICQQES